LGPLSWRRTRKSAYSATIWVGKRRRCCRSLIKNTSSNFGEAAARWSVLFPLMAPVSKGQQTDALPRGGLLRRSEEAGVMPVERREQAIACGSGQPAPGFQWEVAAFARWHEPDDARVSCPDL
jgi:hypothetical protein